MSFASTPQAVRRIHLIFKTHLDVGFTDFAANVVANYFNYYIPKSIELSRQMRQSASPDRFIWTTGSWLIYEYLEKASPAERKNMEAAIEAGDIAWHALPVTTHSEAMDAALFRYGISLAKELDRRFGKHTISAKMTDVPGHTRGIVPLLAEAGVQFLHIGVNGASTPPDVPPVFVWREADSGAEIVVMYHKGSYGELMVVPGMQDAIAFAHTGDNLGPQSAEQLYETYRTMRARFPGAEIFASTMDAFATHLPEIKDSLPLVTQEIGDTWIHGTGSDPLKMAQFRELLRLRRRWSDTGTPPDTLNQFSRHLLMVPEHTWGLDVKTHLNDWTHYRASEFQAVRSQPNYQKVEASWQEQRDYLKKALAALPLPLQHEAADRLAQLNPARPDMSSFQPLDDLSKSFDLPQFKVTFDPQTACITGLESAGKNWSGPLNPLAKFCYETFSAADYQRFHRQYNVNQRATRAWAIPDFTKPGIEDIAASHKTFTPSVAFAGHTASKTGDTFLFLLVMPEESWQVYGAPRQLALEMTFNDRLPIVNFELQWFDKPACRLPEATWLSFIPRTNTPRGWQIEKLGQWISPFDVIRNGNRHLHATGQGIRYHSSRYHLALETLDALLVAPGKPSLLDFNNRQPDLRQGWHFNLNNNVWGTNFPMWFGEDARFRFVLRIEKVTPSGT